MNKEELFVKFMMLLFLTIIVLPLGLLLLSGNILWIEGWILNVWIIIFSISMLFYMYFKDPALLIERIKSHSDEVLKPWDKLWMNSSYIIFILWLIIMPLDGERFKWSFEFTLYMKVIGILLLMAAFYFLYKATVTNTYMSSVVRIQEDRQQTVIDSGVYSIVRHPMYLGAIIMAFGASLLLGSLIGIGISCLVIIMVMYRVVEEEKILIDGLKDYREYIKKVKYRIIPFVW